MRLLSLIFFLLWNTTASADPLQDRLNQISTELTRLFEMFAQGQISEADLFARTDSLTTLEMQLQTGRITPDQVPFARWRDHDEIPVYTAGYELVIANLPADFASPIWATLPNGHRLEVDAVPIQQGEATERAVTLPIHPDGLDHGGTLTFHFGGPAPLGNLTAKLAPVLRIDNALPRLLRLTTGVLIDDLKAQGISPEALLAQFRQAPDRVDPDLGHVALMLWLWSESKAGNQTWSFIQDGRFDTPFWQDFGLTGQADWTLVASAALQNMLTPDLMMRPDPEVLDRIKAPYPPQSARIFKARTGGAAKDVTQITLDAMAQEVVWGRQLKQAREEVIGGLKTAHKLADLTLNWTSETAVASFLVGGVLTVTDQALRKRLRNHPTTIEIRSAPRPAGTVLADDSRALNPVVSIFARSEPVQQLIFADGVDAALLVTDFVLLAGENSKVGKGLKKIDQVLKVKDLTARQVIMLKTGKFITKEAGDQNEQLAELAAKGSFTLYEIPARNWEAVVTQDNYQPYLNIEYSGESQPGQSYFGKACWANTNTGALATIDANSDLFGGAFDREVAQWPVDAPKLAIVPQNGVLEPGESTAVTFTRSGAEAVNIRVFPPNIGALSGGSNDSATYTAPAQIASCSETVVIRAQYPTGADAANICAPPPRFSGTVFIKKGDASIQTPTQLTCRDGEVRGFTVAHAKGAEVQCVLQGPGTLTMVGNEGLLDCPVQPRGPSAITCYTGTAPGACAPVIPIKRIFPEFAVSAFVTADRRQKLNDHVESFFEDCGVEGMTSLALELVDLGTGLADGMLVDAISASCARPDVSSGGAVIDTGTAPEIEVPAEGRYVANWPLGEGRDVSVYDSHSYRHRPYDPGRGPGDRSVLVTSDISAEIVFEGPERFSVITQGSTVATSARAVDEIPTPSGGSASWAVWRRILVTRDTQVRAEINTAGPADVLVQAIPLRLENNVPVALLAGFDQNLTSVMRVGTVAIPGMRTSGSASATALLPGPRQAGGSLTYLVLFTGHTTPAAQANNRVSAASRTTVEIDIKPVVK